MLPPPLVRRALRLAADSGLVASADEQGRLVHVLAAGTGRVRVGAIGAGGAVVAAWVASALEPGVPFVVCEARPDVAAAARSCFADDADVRVLEGDWRGLLPGEAPFDLLVAAEPIAPRDVPAALALLAPRGTAVVLAGGADEAGAWTTREDLATVQVLTGSGFATMVAVRRL